ncbi:hypothetical protein [Kitasatospora sp. NBC_00315]|uniref:hypothetical protein n=1 Tax=Kitasatospora sp. NBC_00315 TaxID=2975963 RepID=UPI00324D9DAF
MPRNGRPRRTALPSCRATGPAGLDRRVRAQARPGARPSPGQAPAGDPARPGRVCITGILTSREDFERARRWNLSDAGDYDSYLLDTALLLAEAHRGFDVVRARMFHPGDFEEFCLLHRLDPAEPAARDRYLVNPPLRAQLLPYQGEELTGDFIPRLVRARDNGLTLCHIDLLLDGALRPDGPPAEDGDDRAGSVRAVRDAHRRAGEIFRRMLVTAGPGVFEFRCAVDAPGGRLEAAARILHWEDGVVRINDEDLDLVCAVLCAGLARELPGSALLTGSRGPAAQGGECAEAAWAWRSGGRDWTSATGGAPAARPGFGLGTMC